MDDSGSPITSLVDAAAAGDEHAWGEIVDRYTPLLASVIGRFQLTTAEIRDVAQTVWLRLVENLGGLREPQALPEWIIATVSQESQRSLADPRRTTPPAEDAAPVAEPRTERREALLAGLAELPARLRELLLLLAEDPPLSRDQISRRTGIPASNIDPARGLALDRLRQTPAVRDHLAARTATVPRER
jgi:RNA polymerase sigma factor (sigma-70 family)